MERRSSPRPSRLKPPRRRTSGLLPVLPAVLAVAAEAGHLAAAYVEWPDSTARGAYHILAGALLGLIAAAVQPRHRLLLAIAAAVAITGPAWWLTGSLLDASPYQQLPTPAAIAVTAAEITLAVLLVAASRTAAPATGRAPAPARSIAGTSSH